MSALQMTCGFPPGASGTPVLETGRLFLRAPKLDDAKVIARLANNRKIAEMTALIPHPYGVDDAKAWIESLSEEGSGWTFAITARMFKKSVSLRKVDWPSWSRRICRISRRSTFSRNRSLFWLWTKQSSAAPCWRM